MYNFKSVPDTESPENLLKYEEPLEVNIILFNISFILKYLFENKLKLFFLGAQQNSGSDVGMLHFEF